MNTFPTYLRRILRMIIKRLYVENWKSFPKKEFIFNEGINLIEGSNYSGKTSFTQALYYGLFRESLYDELTAKELKREGEKDAQIEIDVETDSGQYRIRRNISGERAIYIDSHIYRLEDGKEVEEIEGISRKKEQLQKLKGILNAKKEFVQNINFVQEGSVYLLINNPDYQINEDLDSILQLDYLRKLKEYNTDLIKETDKELDRLEDKKDNVDDFEKEHKEELINLQHEIEALEANQEKFEDQISSLREKKDNYLQLKEIKDEKEKIESEIESLKEKRDFQTSELEDLEKDKEEIERIEKTLGQLRKHSERYKKNKRRLEDLNESKEQIQNKISKIQRQSAILEDRKESLNELKDKTGKLRDSVRHINDIDNKLEEIRKKAENYDNLQDDFSQLTNKKESLKETISKFNKGKCPISNEDCPVSGEIIDSKKLELKDIERKSENLENQLSGLKDPHPKLEELEKKKSKLEEKEKEFDSLKKNIGELKTEIEKLSESEVSEDQLEKEKSEITNKIDLLKKAIKGLEKKHEKYIETKGKIERKSDILKKIKEREKSINEIDEKLQDLRNKISSKNEEIRKFKETHALMDSFDLEKIDKEIESLENQLSELKTDLQKKKINVQNIERDKEQILEPFDSKAELKRAIENYAHKKYQLIFFKDTLELTLEEVRIRKIRAIRDRCNQMWSKFKKGSRMQSIDWDENFLPIVNMGGTTRNMYQLSASEKLMVYFSIRAAILAELGPNYFMVIDNLLNPFMRENQEIMLSLLEDIMEQTDIKQIIFTGFDISPGFSCGNRIKL